VNRLVLGTAGHIDHGKTALVRALTGVDTDRLAEEKERGITIDLGFARLADDDVQIGIVDVPGHEGFIRNMLAGATGVDVVLMAVASDEGVMPQTREHLAIVRLLGVHRLVIALTKADRVEPEWLELVRDEVEELLLESLGLAGAEVPVVPTSVETGEGLEKLTEEIRIVASDAPVHDPADLVRLPIDRAFTVRGTGTVVTGTLWSGTLAAGDRVRLEPGAVEARVRGIQVHGEEVERAQAGERTAVALSGADVGLDRIDRGQTLVALDGWGATSMLTARIEMLPGPGWLLEHNQRVRVHLGTSEVMARAVVLEGGRDPILPGAEGWVQLRLEAPVTARTGDRLVLRSYAPVTTIAGGRVVEDDPPRRGSIARNEVEALEAILTGDEAARARGALRLASWSGIAVAQIPLRAGIPAARLQPIRAALEEEGALDVRGRVLAPAVVEEARARLVATLERTHAEDPLLPVVPLERLREALPRAPEGTADALLEDLEDDGRVELRSGGACLAGFRPRPTEEQRERAGRLATVVEEAGLAPPPLDQLVQRFGREGDGWPLVRLLVDRGTLVKIGEDLYVHAAVLERAVDRVHETLGGRSGLGPTDFKEVLPVSRKHLMPLLAHLDGRGVTLRRDDGREVTDREPAEGGRS